MQTVMALSTTEVEYMEATQACKKAIWIQRLLEELEYKKENKIMCFMIVRVHYTLLGIRSFTQRRRMDFVETVGEY